MPAPEDVYKELALVLSSRKNDVFEIEILPIGFSSLLHDGNFIGITKKALVQAFIFARHMFFDELVHMNEEDFLTISSSTVNRGQEDHGNNEPANGNNSVATEIILLFDCEHLTACNWRKRRLKAIIQCNASSIIDSNGKHGMLASTILEEERSLMTTYLCSPLHRHTKSPTLWQHRLWVMTQLIKVQLEVRVPELVSNNQSKASSLLGFAQQFMLAELRVALRAGEQHPKNYYAFSYIRQLQCLFCRILECNRDEFSEACDDTPCSKLSECMIDSTLTWCLAHPRDISGWQFLLYLLETVAVDRVQRTVIDRVGQFALNVGWEGESLWTFTDLATRKFGKEITRFPPPEESNGSADSSCKESVASHAILPEARWKKWAARAKELRTVASDGDEHGLA
jgi:hypothetical protein